MTYITLPYLRRATITTEVSNARRMIPTAFQQSVDRVQFGKHLDTQIDTNPGRLVPVDSTTNPNYKVEMTFVQLKNCMLRKIYPDCAGIYLRREAAAALLKVQEDLEEQGYGLILYDGYRPLKIVQELWDQTPEDKRGFVSPPETARHSRGTAIDASLYRLKTGAALQMPSVYDESAGPGRKEEIVKF